MYTPFHSSRERKICGRSVTLRGLTDKGFLLKKKRKWKGESKPVLDSAGVGRAK